MLFSFILGAILVFTFAFIDKNDVIDFNQTKSIAYGDIRFDVFKDVNHPDYPEIVESLCISKKDKPFIILYKDSSNTIIRWTIANGKEGLLALSNFDKGRISEFFVFGNKVHNNMRMPVFALNATNKPGVWRNASYIPNVKAVEDNGKIKSYVMKGEKYDDIDFDGQFDAKSLVDEDLNILSQSIYINGEWLEIQNTNTDGTLNKIGYYSAENLEAKALDGKHKVYYDFKVGEGWKKRLPK